MHTIRIMLGESLWNDFTIMSNLYAMDYLLLGFTVFLILNFHTFIAFSDWPPSIFDKRLLGFSFSLFSNTLPFFSTVKKKEEEILLRFIFSLAKYSLCNKCQKESINMYRCIFSNLIGYETILCAQNQHTVHSSILNFYILCKVSWIISVVGLLGKCEHYVNV